MEIKATEIFLIFDKKKNLTQENSDYYGLGHSEDSIMLCKNVSEVRHKMFNPKNIKEWTKIYKTVVFLNFKQKLI